jgi:para-aminobenzoate synthetase/4-amino-4-deoxychorismate lyase
MLPQDSPHSIPAGCFALLDDCTAGSADPRSRLYTSYVGTLSCTDAADLPALLKQMQQALQQGQYAVGLFPYELGAHMHGIAPHDSISTYTQILLFNDCSHLNAGQVTDWLNERMRSNQPMTAIGEQQPAGIANLHASVTDAEFATTIARIHASIEAGDTYQVNYTYRLHFDAYGSPYALYAKLRTSQSVPYGALIGLPDGRAVLSLSPELFVRHSHGELIARPMKGTAAATGDATQDALRAHALANDPKSRAENLMIVDLLRNDLGRIASVGSVQVPRLFEVTRFNQVLQMTSTLRAQLREEVTLPELFTALFPCGSITGAPKRRTMQIIRELESTPRGLYSGAIGWFDPPADANCMGDFCLSVPIRTLVLQASGEHGVRKGEMGVGAGIVHDSVAEDEAAECRLKARFLTALPQDFELLETMHATAAGCRYLERHLPRLRDSADYFGFAYDGDKVRASVLTACTALPAAGEFRMRLSLGQLGTCTLQASPLLPMQLPVTVLLAVQPTDANDLFLRHKTTIRERYDAAWRTAETQGAFDMLFFNTNGELTEGGRSSVFVKLEGRWYTPPLSAGVLPGVMRSVLLDDPTWNASEKHLTLDDLRTAEEIIVCNALRGVLPARVHFG